MRCMDFRGEKLLRGAMPLMCSLIVAIEAAWKILGSSSRVMRRVFDGGAGEERGGNEVRSSESGDRDRFFDTVGEEPADCGGELVSRFEV